MRRTVIFAAALALVLAGCSTKKTSSNGPSASTSASSGATATLTHMPRGSVTVSWNPATHTVLVTGRMTGLAPNSIHPMHIHKGSCANQGGVVHPLPDLKADANGDATIKAAVPGVKEGIPAAGWYLNVHTGPTLAPANQFRPIACVDLKNASPVMTKVQRIVTAFAPLPGPGNNVTGTATLSFNASAKTLTVHLVLSGLDPNSTHAAHVHRGTCDSQGPVAFPLKNVTGDSSGSADVTTTIQSVTPTTEPLYVNVHNTADLSTQIGFTPIACGDVHGS
jgi:Cu/Zn superoxide dismutase